MGITASSFARMLRGLLPPGRVWQLEPGAFLGRLLLAAADELVRVDGRALDLLRETDPRRTVELLTDYERVLDLPSTGTTAERQARVVGALIRRQRFRPVDFQDALALILGLDPLQVEVIEISHAAALLLDDEREIYRFFVFRDPGLGGTWDLPAAQALITKMKPSHTLGFAIESDDFLCDDPYSLCDRDILGA